MDNAVALASIALAATSVGGLVWVMKYFANTLSDDLKEHTKAAQQAASASESLEVTVKKVGKQAELSAANSGEQLKFMKKLNGKLEGAIVQRVTEQTVEHQTVKGKK